jgi:hypothetical protein
MRTGLIIIIWLAVSLVGFGPAQASLVTFSGLDNGAGPLDPRPNSIAAAAAFDAAVGAHNTITFENLLVGYFTIRTVFSGVVVTLTNADSSSSGISYNDPSDPLYGYNTTAGGSKFLMLSPLWNGLTVKETFSFATPISFFGAYLTGTDSAYSGTIILVFNDGTTQSLSVPKNNQNGGVEFFGFTDFDNVISSVTFEEAGPFSNSRDIWGIDDVRFGAAVPLPPPVLLVGTGLLGLALAGRKKRWKK